jgi:hypothetical protein
MDSNYVLGPNGELYHWGIKGMKWGIRRYQNKDGSLTKAGQRRYASENEKLKAREKEIKGREKAAARQAKLDAKKADLDAREAALKNKKKPADEAKPAENKPKSMRDMTDDELREYTTRMQLEKQYIEAQKNLAAAMPQKVSRGQAFMKSVMTDVLVPAAKSAGKDWAENFMKEKLNLKSPTDELKALENEYKKLEWKVKTEDLRKAGTLKEPKEQKGPNWEDFNKRETYRKSIADLESGLEDMQRERKRVEAIFGQNSEQVTRHMKDYAKRHGLDFDEEKEKKA